MCVGETGIRVWAPLCFSSTVWSVFFTDNIHLSPKHLSSVGSLDSISRRFTLDGWTVHHTYTHTPTDNSRSPVQPYTFYAFLWIAGETRSKTLHGTQGVDERPLNLIEYSRQKQNSFYWSNHEVLILRCITPRLHPSSSYRHKLQTLLVFTWWMPLPLCWWKMLLYYQ